VDLLLILRNGKMVAQSLFSTFSNFSIFKAINGEVISIPDRQQMVVCGCVEVQDSGCYSIEPDGCIVII